MNQKLQTPKLEKIPITLPLKLSLTNDGIAYCANKQILTRDIITYGGKKKTGLLLTSFKGPILQRLILNKFINSIDVDRIELLTKRSDIIDVTKLLVYGILYKKFKPTLKHILYESDAMYKLIQAQKIRNIKPDFKFNPEVVNNFMLSNDKTIRTLKLSLTYDPIALVNKDRSLDQDEKNKKRLIVERLIDQIDNNTWFMYHFLNKSNTKLDILHNMNEVVSAFVYKTNIADYISLILMELIQNAEKVHYQRIAKIKNFVADEKQFEAVIRMKDFREELNDYAKKNNHMLNLNFSIDGDHTNMQNKMRLQIAITNKGLIMERTRRALQDKSIKHTSEKSLANFYRDSGEKKTGAGLGLYYLSYVEDECKKADIKFESRIISDHNRDETTVTLYLYI